MTGILLLPLLAAVMHAAWHAMLKTSADRLTTLAAIALVTSILGVGMILSVAPPAPASWPYIGLSTLFHYLGYASLFFLYRVGDLSVVYPIARGVAPLLVALGAAIFVGEVLPWEAQVGLAITCAGISALSIGHIRSMGTGPFPIVLAFGMGFIIAGYSVADGIGIRLAQSPFGFMGWIFLLEFPVVFIAAFARRAVLLKTVAINWRYGLIGGVTSVTAYGLVVYASAFAPIAIVSALHETSVIFAALIGTMVMKERPWQQRVGFSAVVAGGVAMMTVFR